MIFVDDEPNCGCGCDKQNNAPVYPVVEKLDSLQTSVDNVLTYNYSPGVELGSVISSDDVLAYIVELSSNAQAYKDAKAAHPEVTSVSYGNGCDLTNMGFCYNSETGEMKVVLSNQFTTYLYNYYSNGGNVPANTINDDNESFPAFPNVE